MLEFLKWLSAVDKRAKVPWVGESVKKFYEAVVYVLEGRTVDWTDPNVTKGPGE